MLTLTADISQFEYMRPKRGLMQWQGVFEEQQIHRRWAKRPSHIRSWEGIQLAASLAIPAAFDADKRIKVVRFWIGDITQNIPVYRVSIEALRDEERYDVRYDQTGRHLSPIIPHGDEQEAFETSIADRLAENPTDFEHQVAGALERLGLAVEVVGGSADGGIDIVARDSTPITGGRYIVQCKRYREGQSVGVGVIRELYGAVQAEGADKGILVTSSSFTVPARKFAEGKPLELIDGAGLRSLIGKQQQTTREDDTKSYGVQKQLTFTSSIDKPGIHAGVESDSVFEPIKALVFRGYVANQTSQSIFRPEVSITLKDKHTGERFTSKWDVNDLVLPAGISAPFEVRFTPSEYPEAWEIDAIEATEGDGKRFYIFSENVDASLYSDLDISLVGETSNLAYQFQIINTGNTTPEYVQVFLVLWMQTVFI